MPNRSNEVLRFLHWPHMEINSSFLTSGKVSMRSDHGSIRECKRLSSKNWMWSRLGSVGQDPEWQMVLSTCQASHRVVISAIHSSSQQWAEKLQPARRGPDWLPPEDEEAQHRNEGDGSGRLEPFVNCVEPAKIGWCYGWRTSNHSPGGL